MLCKGVSVVMSAECCYHLDQLRGMTLIPPFHLLAISLLPGWILGGSKNHASLSFSPQSPHTRSPDPSVAIVSWWRTRTGLSNTIGDHSP